MGFLDRFKKKNNTERETEATGSRPVEQLPFHVEYSLTANGDLLVEFYDRKADFRQTYDTTRLRVGQKPFDLEGHQVYLGKISWGKFDDARILDPTRQGEFYVDEQEILAELDLSLLQSDLNYCNMVMKYLLDKKRVERYLQSGLKENAEQPNGIYIGGVGVRENGYYKFFNERVGKASHHSDYMKGKRQQHREREEEQKRRYKERLKSQIEKLQDELDRME